MLLNQGSNHIKAKQKTDELWSNQHFKQELNTEEWTMQIGDLQLKPIKRL